MSKTLATYLLDEPPILVYPTLAAKLGLDRAVMLQQLHFLLNITEKTKRKYNFVNDRWWVYNSYPEWVEHFPWLTAEAIRKHFKKLEDQGIVISISSVKAALDRRKWYSIDYQAYESWLTESNARSGKKVRIDKATDPVKKSECNRYKSPDDLTETPESETPISDIFVATPQPAPKNSAHAENSDTSPFYAIGESLFNCRTKADYDANGWRIGKVLYGDKHKNGKIKCAGLNAFELARAAELGEAVPDAPTLAKMIKQFAEDLGQKNPEMELFECSKFMTHWTKWRNSTQRAREKVITFDPNCHRKCNKGWHYNGVDSRTGKEIKAKCSCWDYR